MSVCAAAIRRPENAASMTNDGAIRPTIRRAPPRRSSSGRWGALIALALLLGGCRTESADIERWANTQHGPEKLVAVVTHDKYPDALRVQAALTLVRMKPRAGRRVGLEGFVSALSALSEDERERLVEGIVPELEQSLRNPPPKPDAHGVRPPDPTIPDKDAAHALLTGPSPFIADEALRRALEAALVDWVMLDFSARLDDASQAYGMHALLSVLGPQSVKRLPTLIAADEPKIGSIAGFVAELGDAETKLRASERLVEVARDVESAAWRTRKAVDLRAANAAAGLEVDAKRFDAQLDRYQDEELLRVFASLKKVGQLPALRYLLALATDTRQKEPRRAAALAALEGHAAEGDAAAEQALIGLAERDATPDVVREQALRRLGELPRERTLARLYALFASPRWKVRWVAAETSLKTAKVEDVPAFMTNLAKVRHMSITEPIRYGHWLGRIAGVERAPHVLSPYLGADQRAPVRLAALGFFHELGTESQLPLVSRYENDAMPVPGCASNADGCEWQCEIEAGDDREARAIATIGDFVRHCVQPAMKGRTSAPSLDDLALASP